jgi:hypothetical protein
MKLKDRDELINGVECYVGFINQYLGLEETETWLEARVNKMRLKNKATRTLRRAYFHKIRSE